MPGSSDFENQIFGFEELTKKLNSLGAALGGKALRSAARSAMLPAKKAAQAAAPKGGGPYIYAGKSSGKKGYNYGTLRAFDPYPRKTYRGLVVAPGFSSRSLSIKTWLSRDKSQTNVMLGVKPEAFEALQFVELGTSYQKAQPWLEPSFRASIPLVASRFKVQLKKQLEKASRI